MSENLFEPWSASPRADQILDLNQTQEQGRLQWLLPVGFFVVVLSLAAYAMTWCSNGKPFCSSRDLAELYQCSRDLFQSSILALLSSALVTISKVSPWPATIKYSFYGLHWLFFSVAILLAWWATQRLLPISARPNLNIEPPR